MFSAARRKRAFSPFSRASSVRRPATGELWAKKPRATMSPLCARAARSSAGSAASGFRPRAQRATLVWCSTAASNSPWSSAPEAGMGAA